MHVDKVMRHRSVLGAHRWPTTCLCFTTWLDRVPHPPAHPDAYPLQVGSKFEYVVAVQTYGRNATSKDLRLRQLAQGVDTLMLR